MQFSSLQTTFLNSIIREHMVNKHLHPNSLKPNQIYASLSEYAILDTEIRFLISTSAFVEILCLSPLVWDAISDMDDVFQACVPGSPRITTFSVVRTCQLYHHA